MYNRRDFLRALACSGVASTLGLSGSPWAAGRGGKVSARVVVVGGGYGGAIVAKYLRRADPSIQVTLVEKEPNYVSCPFSNKVLAGLMNLEELTFDYRGLRDKHGVTVIHDTATRVDPTRKTVSLQGGQTLEADYLVLSPGVDFDWEAVEGYGPEAVEQLPHAWKAGPQTQLLRAQLEAMEDGETVIIGAPPNPFRCPPGPYERASLIAHYLKQHKPKSKVVIMDAKDAFSKQKLFEQAWKKLYPGRIEWISAAADGKVLRVDPGKKIAYTEFGEHQAGVLNLIPPQRAGKIAVDSDLADASGWCPVNQKTFESSRHPGVYVVGDACVAGKMPKSGYAANSQAKVCVSAIVAAIQSREPVTPSYVNTCYSVLAPGYGISVAAVYELGEQGIVGVEGAGGLSPLHAPPLVREHEAMYARGWFKSITQDMFA